MDKTIVDKKIFFVPGHIVSVATRLPAFIRIILSKLNHFIIRNQFTIMLIIDSF